METRILKIIWVRSW